MNIKVQCPCGQGFECEVEPVNGQMPCAINCPTCGADATALANQAIHDSLFTPPPTAAPPASGLRINRAPALIAAAAPVEQPKRFGYTRTLDPDKEPAPSDERLLLGAVGGLAAGFVAMLIWYSITLATDHEFGIVAWGVGVLSGVGVRVLGRSGTPMLGYIAAICAGVAILGGEFLVVSHVTNNYMRKFVSGAYQKRLAAAHEAVNLKTDPEIRAWLEGHKANSAPVSPNEIDEFRAHGQAKMQDFINGTPTQAEYEKDLLARLTSFSVKLEIMKKAMSLFIVIWLAFGIASAYRIASA